MNPKPVRMNTEIRTAADTLSEACHANAYNSGWWHNPDGSERNLDPKTEEGLKAIAWPLLLQISEIIEGAEGARKGLKDDKLPHRDMLEVELADAVIRIFDMAGGLKMDLGGAITEKLEYNRNRADHKMENRVADGGKRF